MASPDVFGTLTICLLRPGLRWRFARDRGARRPGVRIDLGYAHGLCCRILRLCVAVWDLAGLCASLGPRTRNGSYNGDLAMDSASQLRRLLDLVLDLPSGRVE